MNTLILSNYENTYGEYKQALGIKDKQSFETFIEQLKTVDDERLNFGLVNTGFCLEIAKTLECFHVDFREGHPDMLIIDDLQAINDDLTDGEIESDLEVLLWISKGMTENLSDSIDENIRYDGETHNNEFLCNVRDFLLNTHIKVDNYELLNLNNSKQTISLNKTNDIPEKQAFLHEQQEILRYFGNTGQEIRLELYPDNVLEIAIYKNGELLNAFDTAENIANHFNSFEVPKDEIIKYANNHINTNMKG